VAPCRGRSWQHGCLWIGAPTTDSFAWLMVTDRLTRPSSHHAYHRGPQQQELATAKGQKAAAQSGQRSSLPFTVFKTERPDCLSFVRPSEPPSSSSSSSSSSKDGLGHVHEPVVLPALHDHGDAPGDARAQVQLRRGASCGLVSWQRCLAATCWIECSSESASSRS